jgi:hypothetical protein
MFDSQAGITDATADAVFRSGGLVLLHTLGMPQVHNPTSGVIHVTYWQHRRGTLAEPEALGRVDKPATWINLYPGQRASVPYGATAVIEVDEWRAPSSLIRMLHKATALRVMR